MAFSSETQQELRLRSGRRAPAARSLTQTGLPCEIENPGFLIGYHTNGERTMSRPRTLVADVSSVAMIILLSVTFSTNTALAHHCKGKHSNDPGCDGGTEPPADPAVNPALAFTTLSDDSKLAFDIQCDTKSYEGIRVADIGIDPVTGQHSLTNIVQITTGIENGAVIDWRPSWTAAP